LSFIFENSGLFIIYFNYDSGHDYILRLYDLQVTIQQKLKIF